MPGGPMQSDRQPHEGWSVAMEHPYDPFAEHQPWPEGPVVAPDGWILNVCSFTIPDTGWTARGGDISATHVDVPLATHKLFNTSTPDVEGIPCALAFGPDGCLYVTDEGRRAIVRVAPDGSITDFVTTWDGHGLNGPNDLSFDPDGNLYFTDPWGSSPDSLIGQVFGYEWATRELHRIDTGMAFPNGIVVRDGRLYVAETYTNRVWTYEVTGPGRAAGKREFCRMPDVPDSPVRWQGRALAGPDGMALDAAGNLYVAHVGTGSVFVYDRDGREIDALPTGGRKATNVCFGGPSYDDLFVTVDDRSSMIRFALGVEGHRLSFCPSLSAAHSWSAMLPAIPGGATAERG
jgi:gluconolactonase